MPPEPSVTSASERPLPCTLRYSSALLPKSFERPGPKSVSPATYCSGVEVVVWWRWIVDMRAPYLVGVTQDSILAFGLGRVYHNPQGGLGRAPTIASQAGAQHAAPLQRLRQRRTELAGPERVEGAKAGGEFGSGQAALAVKAAEKIGGGGFPFLRIAFHATGDQVAVGIAPRPRLRHDVVQALDRRRGAAQTVEALVALAGVDGIAQRLVLHEVHALEIHRRAGAGAFFFGGGAACDAVQPRGGNLLGQAHLDHVPGFAALDHAQSVLGDKAANGLAHRT